MHIRQLIRHLAKPPVKSVPDWMLGCFKRRSISFASGDCDTDTHVFWLQGRNMTIDLRLPIELEQIPNKALEGYSREALHAWANYEGWYAETVWKDNKRRSQELTNNFLKDGLEVMEEWGFTYVTNLVWAKNTIGLGYYFRGQHEICLFGKKGQMKPKSRSESTLVTAKKSKHSKKPEEFYEKIEALNSGPKIELFARNTREGWDSWGNEV